RRSRTVVLSAQRRLIILRRCASLRRAGVSKSPISAPGAALLAAISPPPSASASRHTSFYLTCRTPALHWPAPKTKPCLFHCPLHPQLRRFRARRRERARGAAKPRTNGGPSTLRIPPEAPDFHLVN